MENLTAGLLFNDTMVMIAGGTGSSSSSQSIQDSHPDVEFTDGSHLYDYDSSPCSTNSSSNNSTSSPVYYGAPGGGPVNSDLFTEFEFNAFEFAEESAFLGGNHASSPEEEHSYMEELISSDLSSDEDKFLESIRYGGSVFTHHHHHHQNSGGGGGTHSSSSGASSAAGGDLLSEEELVNTIQTYGDVKVVQVEGVTVSTTLVDGQSDSIQDEQDAAEKLIIEGIERGVVGGGSTRIIEVVDNTAALIKEEDGEGQLPPVRVLSSGVKKRKSSVTAGGVNALRGAAVKRVTIIQQQPQQKKQSKQTHHVHHHDLDDEIIIETPGGMADLLSPSPGSPQQAAQDQTNGSYQELKLSEEEKRLLLKEGISLPTHYPLTKLEERELKRIRRKIRNKISAQDSRKRKKEFLDRLQQRVQEVEDEKSLLQKRIRSLESINTKLNAQVKRLQQALSSAAAAATSGGGQVGSGAGGNKQTVVPAATTLLVLILSLALVVLPTVEKQQQGGALSESQGNEIISLLNRSNNELGREKTTGRVIGGGSGSGSTATTTGVAKQQGPRSRAMVNEAMDEDGELDYDKNDVVELIGEMRSIVMRMRGGAGRKRNSGDNIGMMNGKFGKRGRFGEWSGGGGAISSSKPFGGGGRSSSSSLMRDQDQAGGWWASDDDGDNTIDAFEGERRRLRAGTRAFQNHNNIVVDDMHVD